MLSAFAVSGYLCFVNLDYAALWYDEGATAGIAKNLIERGDIIGWDGRNLIGGTNGRSLNEDLRDVFPPLMYVWTALGFKLFGVNEVGARIVHALIGLLALGVFYLLLRQHLPKHDRLVCNIFVLAAGSAQMLLYFRQSRYYAFMALGLIASFYLYERYWQEKKTRHLAALTLVGAAAFFNHYSGGTATVLAVAAWHVLFRARETTAREWTAFATCVSAIALAGLGYLVFMGLVGAERTGFLSYSGRISVGHYQGTIGVLLLRILVYTRELFTADWVSWPVALWFLYALWQTRQTSESEREGLPVAGTSKIVLMGILFTFFAAATSQYPMRPHAGAELRYYVSALPLLLAMKGAFVEWVWPRSKITALIILMFMLYTSAGAFPFNVRMGFSGFPTLGMHLTQFIAEIHHPYRDSIREVSDYLLTHAKQDEKVYVKDFGARESLIFYLGDRVFFCCVLDENSLFPPNHFNKELYAEKDTADWIVVFGKLPSNTEAELEDEYRLVARFDVHPYPTQRPEINLHAFQPLPVKDGVRIWRRTKERTAP